MSILKTLIVEYDYEYAKELKALMFEFGHQCIGTVDNAKDALSLINEHHPDLILINVSLKGKTDGIQLGEKIKEKSIPIVYLSAFKEQALYEWAKHTKLYAYIIKPIDKLTLRSILDTLTREKDDKTPGEQHLYVRMKNQYLKIQINEILWIKSEGNYCEIKTENKKFVTKNSLIKLKKRLPEKYFVQVYRSFLINIRKVENLNSKKNIVWIGKEEIPLGRKYKMNLINKLNLI